MVIQEGDKGKLSKKVAKAFRDLYQSPFAILGVLFLKIAPNIPKYKDVQVPC